MTKTAIKAMAGLALLGGVILATSIVWAKPTTYEVACEFNYGGTPERFWYAGWKAGQDRIVQIRDITYTLTSKAGSGNIEIAIAGVCNHVRNWYTGDGHFWGHDHSIEVTWEGKTGTFRGSHSGKAIDWIGYSKHVYNGVSGDFVGWKLHLNGIFYFLSTPPKEGEFSGVLISPHGE